MERQAPSQGGSSAGQTQLLSLQTFPFSQDSPVFSRSMGWVHCPEPSQTSFVQRLLSVVQGASAALFRMTHRPDEQTASLQGSVGCVQGLLALQEHLPLRRHLPEQHCLPRRQEVPA